MKKDFIISLIFLVFLTKINAQSRGTCGAYEAFQRTVRETPNAQTEIQRYNETLTAIIRNILANLSTPELHTDRYTIPVVFHIVKNKSDVVFTQREIQNVLDSLNYYFGEGRTYTRPPSRYSGVFKRETHIRFALARRTPDNRAMAKPGMNEVDVPDVRLTNDNVRKSSAGGVDPWDLSRYVNIWVCDLDSGSPNSTLFGVGSFPELASVDTRQGVAINYILFKPNLISRFDQQLRTFAHELGHFFGLRHIWGDASPPQSDFVDDTPLSPLHDNMCPSPDDNTMFMNYMDYSGDRCRYMFTRGQVARMLSTMAPGAPRASLLTSNALMPPNVTERNFLNDLLLMPAEQSRPSWQVALIMLHGWSCQCSPEVNTLMSQLRQSFRGLPGLPTDISQMSQALAITNYRELLVSYSMRDFYRLLSNGPIAVIAVGTAGEPYGLVISGMRFNTSGQGQLLITDPLSIGPRGFNFQYVNDHSVVNPNVGGSQYTVDYNTFFTDLMGNALRNNKRIFLFSH